MLSWRGAASYVTGRQSLKVGYQAEHQISDGFSYTNTQFLDFRVNNGVPNQLTQNINAFKQKSRVRFDAFYAQEQWTLGRVTRPGRASVRLCPKLLSRADGPRAAIPADLHHLSTDRRRHRLQGPDAARGSGVGRVRDRENVDQDQRRQVRAERQQRSDLHRREPVGTTHHHRDTDVDRRNGNFMPDCDLLNPLAQNNRASGGDLCAQISDVNFGRDRFTTTLDPKLLNGWCDRPGDWQYGVSVQQQVLPRVSIEVGYNRRWLTNFTVTDNRLQAVDRPRDLQRHGADRLPAARRGVGPRPLGPVQRQPERGVAGRSGPDAGRGLRHLLAGQPRHPVQHQRAPPERSGLPGRREHGRHAHRLLRHPGGAARAERGPACRRPTHGATRRPAG